MPLRYCFSYSCYGLWAVGLVPADQKVLLTSYLRLCPYSLKLFYSDSRLSPFRALLITLVYTSDSTLPVPTSNCTHLVVLITLALTPQCLTPEHSGLDF